MIITARKLLNYSTEELWDILTGEFTLVFDDGEQVVTTANKTIFSSYCWDMHRHFTRIPLLYRHHAQSISENHITTKTHCDIMNRIVEDVMASDYPHLFESQHDLRDVLANIAYEVMISINNAIITRMQEFVLGMDFDTMMEVQMHSEVFGANEKLRSDYKEAEAQLGDTELLEVTDTLIHGTYKKIESTIRSNPDLRDNVLSKLLNCGIPNTKQLLQCLSARGYMTRTNSMIIKKPVLYGYLEGIRAFEDSFCEAQSGAKALVYQTSPLESVQYFARKLRLLAQFIQNLHHGDCGSTKYWLFDNVKERDLSRLDGCYYLDENTGQLAVVKTSSKHLVGKNLKLRSIRHCHHYDSQGVCSTCFGKLAFAVTRGVNLGNMCSTSFTKVVAQLVLSVKHFDGTSTVRPIVLDENAKRFFQVRRDKSTFFLNPKLKKESKHLKMVIDKNSADNINNIFYVDDVGSLYIPNISSISTVRFYVTGDRDETSETDIDVFVDNRVASMTHSLLNYIKENPYQLDEKENYVIDLDKWDCNKPMFSLPLQHFNMLNYQKDIERRIESTLEELNKRDNETNVDGVMRELYEFINMQLDVHASVIQAIFYASLVIKSSDGRFEIPKGNERASLGVLNATITGRSLGAWASLEQHVKLFKTPLCYTMKNRLDHPADGMIIPEILNNNYRV